MLDCKNNTHIKYMSDGTQKELSIDWNKVAATSRTSLSIQVFPTPQMRRGHPLHDSIFAGLKNLGVSYARLQPWYCYPRLGVAELEPPENGTTSWDFTLIDPIVLDFFNATQGKPVMFCFGTIPEWMFKTDKPVPYPLDPDEECWGYSSCRILRDTTYAEVADYFHRLASWYLKGGFTDEYGRFHKSGHHFKIDYWEVLNESDQNTQHELTPKQYTDIYDVVVKDLHQLDSGMKFSGLTLAYPAGGSKYFEYFLNHKNHKPGVQLDMISYHFYATGGADWLEGNQLEEQKYAYFTQVDNFMKTVISIDSIRASLSPETQTYINEFGSFSAGPQDGQAGINFQIPSFYWSLSGAMFAYGYPQLVKAGIDIVALAELFDFPGQYAGASSIDWNTGRPNPRYRVLQLLNGNFGPGDKLVESGEQDTSFIAQGIITAKGARKILLVNKMSKQQTITIRGLNGSKIEYVDETTALNPPASSKLTNDIINLNPYEVGVFTLR